MADYQNLNTYAGSLYGEPRYQGIGYDWEVPENLVIGSPGGVSDVYHGWTKGFYGRGNTSSDVYAGQRDRYISGVYGSLYDTGQSASDAMGYYPAPPDYQYWQNEVPGSYSYSKSAASLWAPAMTAYAGPSGNTQKKAHIEGYEHEDSDDEFDLIEEADDLGNELQTANDDIEEKVETTIKSSFKTDSTTPPWVVFLFLILLFIAFDFWAEAGHRFISQRFHEGEIPSWERSVLYAVGVTAIFVFVIWLVGVPLTTFETI
uniref:Transmembrane protein n=1 Tax=Marseillevirus LCMAC101 TaxID=2506602 RepID=A0A481YT86_9VIRU|nr:MAG: uncharacterized protein LCMAC101_03010 [Marseillevirus LCMAC101]